MMRRRLLRNIWLSIALALVLACCCQPAAAYDLTVTAWIDGYSQLIIQGKTVQWHHIAWTVPGKEYGHDDPTKLTTVDMGTVDWYPTWSLPVNQPQDSDKFTGLNLPLAAVDQIVGFMGVDVRWDAFISQQPTSGNGYTLIVDFNDSPPSGADYYTVQLFYIPATAAVPLPGTLTLVAPGLLGLAVSARHRLIRKK